MITGPPGVGKSEFTIWLAAQLDMPIYRLCLTSPRLTDDRLAQLLSQSAVKHNSVLVQIDEFQQAMQNWLRGNTSTDHESAGITAGGFCECLQGSTAMGRGVIVLTGTLEMVNDEAKENLPAVFRRVHREAHIGWLLVEDVRHFFRQFLLGFMPECRESEWKQWEKLFLDKKGPWLSRSAISVDMMKQFFMHQITEASSQGLGGFVPSGQPGSTKFLIESCKYHNFMELICDVKAARSFLGSYAPVITASEVPRKTRKVE
jgi:hypothetical protein